MKDAVLTIECGGEKVSVNVHSLNDLDGDCLAEAARELFKELPPVLN